MDKFVPHKIDAENSFESDFFGDVKAGFPCPVENMRERLDLIKLLVRHKASTFFFRVSGVSMVYAAMDEGDIIIVDRAVEPYNNCKAVCYVDGEYTVKRVEIYENGVRLMPANENNMAREHRITSILDSINKTFRKGTIRLAAQGNGIIKSSSENQSPHYTTLWSDLPTVSVK